MCTSEVPWLMEADSLDGSDTEQGPASLASGVWDASSRPRCQLPLAPLFPLPEQNCHSLSRTCRGRRRAPRDYSCVGVCAFQTQQGQDWTERGWKWLGSWATGQDMGVKLQAPAGYQRLLKDNHCQCEESYACDPQFHMKLLPSRCLSSLWHQEPL